MSDSLVFFSIGGNLGERKSNLEEACDFLLFNIGDIVLQSSVYETAPWGMPEGTPSFLNQVLAVKTPLTLDKIKQEIEEIDEYYGRSRKGDVYQNREMDVDVLFYNDEIVEIPLQVPHPKLHERAFILKPLEEIAPDLIHPLLQKKISVLLKECSDTGLVKKI